MIQANELRIGNYIDFNGMESIIKEIDNQGVVVFIKETDETEWIDLFQFAPILLTEEILVKCGATVDGIEHIIKARALPIKIRFHSGIAYCEFGNVYLGDRIKHLHQLQNLYYALCGEELEVKI